MEGRAFLAAFGMAPSPVAAALADRLERTNDATRAEADRRHLARYRIYVDALSPAPDIAIIGHIHDPLDDPSRTPRLIVPGSWHTGGSYLEVDDDGARLVVLPDR